jgi:DNA-binding transcriptional regulator YhcF (GntR family)
VPPVQRYEPAWKQIADHFKNEILEGRLATGDRLPTVREVRDQWGVSQGTAQQAYSHLHLAERLVRTEPGGGTYVDKPRAALSPQQRWRLAAAPVSEVVTVTFAGLVPAPEYVRPMFGLGEGASVIRREEVTRMTDSSPSRLSVTWAHPRYAFLVPELLEAAPLPDPRGAGHLIAGRADLDPDSLTGGVAFEARQAKDDGRELPALDLQPGAYVLAGVSGWRNGVNLLEYTEFVLPPNRVVEADIEP